ncbi:DUF262 domain-containing protein [Rhodobacter capsulatus]|jgi:hypothetical protein|uniref:DUF262 domain-containing protein n=1 Tax=Rhodobacter capsulatus TaxID=1061 RepID=UPI0003D346D1|nr:DUF262 domain-containing protein [Rhodobacter capsulatus]ETD02085.1 hypothetical protein U714_07780 [Rhodobacter capsulatus DE442]ETD77759.1 hypothetical protein U717_07955 [Rhodobacter capsulatus R121]ETE54117.1 hypothetical protein U715_07955 [Rhodobacter capsulatus Y262]MDS0926717.1 DUF262 domain-containing protein [Rhodobacter capsulatus]TQD37422.1 DUF262 domain-containing protein [Rhodobacter capsulatus]
MATQTIITDPQRMTEEGTSFGTPSGIERELPSELGNDLQIAEPFNPDDIDVTTRSMTIDLLLSRIRSKAIDLEPDFQRRRGIWTDRQQSRLIESLLLRIPLPTLYAAEDEEENWAIVDGIQRLTTITRFIDPEAIGETPLMLTGLEYLGESFNEKLFDDLPARLKRRLRETELVVHVIRHGTPQEVKFNIFARINTGGMPLSAQELRHALIPGKARNYLSRLAGLEAFKQATANSIRDERMADREMVLRFLAFSMTDPKEFRAYDFDRFLGDAMREINRLNNRDLERLEDGFTRAMESALEIFGQDAFRKRYRETDARFPINKALFETIAVSLSNLSDSERARCILRHDEVRRRMMEAMHDREFDAAISQGTGDIRKVRKRFETVLKIFKDISDV